MKFQAPSKKSLAFVVVMFAIAGGLAYASKTVKESGPVVSICEQPEVVNLHMQLIDARYTAELKFDPTGTDFELEYGKDIVQLKKENDVTLCERNISFPKLDKDVISRFTVTMYENGRFDLELQ